MAEVAACNLDGDGHALLRAKVLRDLDKCSGAGGRARLGAGTENVRRARKIQQIDDCCLRAFAPTARDAWVPMVHNPWQGVLQLNEHVLRIR